MKAMEIIDKVEAALLKQGEKSGEWEREDFKCLYRDSQGRRCAVGWLFREEDYSPHMEGIGIRGLFEDYDLSYIVPDDMDEEPALILLYDLQTIHDVRDVASWPQEFAKLRQKCNSVTVGVTDNSNASVTP